MVEAERKDLVRVVVDFDLSADLISDCVVSVIILIQRELLVKGELELLCCKWCTEEVLVNLRNV